jgi:hypothetical protein
MTSILYHIFFIIAIVSLDLLIDSLQKGVFTIVQECEINMSKEMRTMYQPYFYLVCGVDDYDTIFDKRATPFAARNVQAVVDAHAKGVNLGVENYLYTPSDSPYILGRAFRYQTNWFLSNWQANAKGVINSYDPELFERNTYQEQMRLAYNRLSMSITEFDIDRYIVRQDDMNFIGLIVDGVPPPMSSMLFTYMKQEGQMFGSQNLYSHIKHGEITKLENETPLQPIWETKDSLFYYKDGKRKTTTDNLPSYAQKNLAGFTLRLKFFRNGQNLNWLRAEDLQNHLYETMFVFREMMRFNVRQSELKFFFYLHWTLPYVGHKAVQVGF